LVLGAHYHQSRAGNRGQEAGRRRKGRDKGEVAHGKWRLVCFLLEIVEGRI